MAEENPNSIAEKYKKRLMKELKAKEKKPSYVAQIKKASERGKFYSSNYEHFKKENSPRHISLYEKACNFSERVLKLKPDKKSQESLQRSIEIAHLSITPAGVTALSILVLLGFLLFAGLVWLVLGSLLGAGGLVMTGLFVMMGLGKIPEFIADKWRLKASNQMVQCIFYMASFMRHTSNLELAVIFAAERLAPPLSLDLKKVLWDVETDKYETIKESLDSYLQNWRGLNDEFIESMHLIEGSLYEGSDDKRVIMIDKAIKIMLEETYEKMLRYSHELKGPVTMLYMMGLVLPILGLVILPLAASFLTSDIDPGTLTFVIAAIYNFGLPAALFFLAKTTLSKRPTGYGETSIDEEIPDLKKYRKLIFNVAGKELRISPMMMSLLIGMPLIFFSILPLLFPVFLDAASLVNEDSWFNTNHLGFFTVLDYKASDKGFSEVETEDGGVQVVSKASGPYGLGAAVLSFLIPLGIGLGFGTYFYLKTRRLIKIKTASQELEEEFAASLFQLGNRIDDGIPVESAVGRVAENMKGTKSAEFFDLINTNISERGMSLEAAIFDKKRGGLAKFPSPMIEGSMKVLIESAKKGPQSASSSLINLSEYIKDIHRVTERLRDLMAEVISDMKQQVKFLAPVIAAVVVGITSMIINILGMLSDQITNLTSGEGGVDAASGLLESFGEGIPTYYFQAIIGIYIVQMTYIMVILINGIESGSDKLKENNLLGKTLLQSSITYSVLACTLMIAFNAISLTLIGSVLAE